MQQAFKYPIALDMEPFVEGRAWDGNDNSDESQVRYSVKVVAVNYERRFWDVTLLELRSRLFWNELLGISVGYSTEWRLIADCQFLSTDDRLLNSLYLIVPIAQPPTIN